MNLSVSKRASFSERESEERPPLSLSPHGREETDAECIGTRRSSQTRSMLDLQGRLEYPRGELNVHACPMRHLGRQSDDKEKTEGEGLSVQGTWMRTVRTLFDALASLKI